VDVGAGVLVEVEGEGAGEGAFVGADTVTDAVGAAGCCLS
jgi:hypothetical protein